jgi:hypothetical protein
MFRCLNRDVLLPDVLKSDVRSKLGPAGSMAVMVHEFEILQPALGICSWSDITACLIVAVS